MESSEVAKDAGRTGTLVCFAVKEEAAPFLDFAKENNGVSVLVTGIGRKNAEKSVAEFFAKTVPARVFTCGFAGGLNPDLAIGDLVFQTTEENLRAALVAVGAKPAKFFCANRVAITVAEKKQCRDETGCDVVEMESEAIAKLCAARQIPCATLRVISDTAGQDLPLDFNALMTSDYKLSSSKLAFALMKSPGAVPRLLELQRNTQLGAQKLADVLGALLRLLHGG